MIDVNRSINIAVKTGKVLFGRSNAVKTARIGKARLIIISANCPRDLREDLEYYCKLSTLPIFVYSGTSIDLGITCGKPFMVSALTIRDSGDSDILKITETDNV